MALTPEDVVNKRFNPTKFREGYDQDEVDDFLDEVVVELRRLNQENEELRQRLIAGEARINELQRGGGGLAAAAAEPAAVVPEPTPEPVAAQPEPVAEVAPEPEPVVEQQPEPVAEVVPEAAPEPVAAPEQAASDAESETDSTNSLLQLARRLHEEHVRDGVAKRDALIAEGQETANKLVSDAQEQTSRLVADAQEKSRDVIARMESRKSELQSSIDHLSEFESEYRAKLKSYIEGQLHELEVTSAVRPSADAPTAAFAGAGAGSDSASSALGADS